MEYKNAIFVVSEERYCPLYNVGDEFNILRDALTIPGVKPACLILLRSIMRVTEGQGAIKKQSIFGASQNVKFECGGCSGLICFEYKKDKEYATTQMKLLATSKKRKENCALEEFSGVLKSFPMFAPLNDADLQDLFSLLRFKKYGPDEIIMRKGDPAANLNIVLTGQAEVVDKNGVHISFLGSGDVFGEMSLLTGAPVVTSVYSRKNTRTASLTSKDFKHVLHRYPVLHVFFYRLMTERSAETNKRAGNDISTGMSGDLSQIHVVDLFQMINSGQKTGVVEMNIVKGFAGVCFDQGELIHAEYDGMVGKEAFFQLLGVTKGQFTFSPGLPKEAEGLDVIGGFMGLIMEGMQRLDEGPSAGAQTPGNDSDQYF